MRRLACVGLFVAVTAPVFAQEMPSDYRAVLDTLGRQGDFKANVLKVNIPRSDLKVTIQGTPVPTPLGFGGWVALTKGEYGMDVMMGDLVLTEDEVNPVMSALLDNGLEVAALHNHFFWETPRIFYMHVHGHGSPADLARQVKPALALIGKPAAAAPAATASAPAPAAAPPSVTGAVVAKIIGHDGEQTGTVYKITIGRDDLNVREMGAVINARMGLNTWAAFAGTDQQAMVAGDIAMLGPEVTPVLKALRSHNIDIVAIHHHMVGTEPAIYFLHYWGKGPAETLATGVKAAVDLLGKAPAPRSTVR
jgi:hypothetical protein